MNFYNEPAVAQEFLPLYKKKISLPFDALIHVHYITEESIKMLKDAGCYRVEIGVRALMSAFEKAC